MEDSDNTVMEDVTGNLANVTLQDDDDEKLPATKGIHSFLQKMGEEYYHGKEVPFHEDYSNIVFKLWESRGLKFSNDLPPVNVCNSIEYHIQKRLGKIDDITDGEDIIPAKFLTNYYIDCYIYSVVYYYLYSCGGVHREIIPLEVFIDKLRDLMEKELLLLCIREEITVYCYYINMRSGEIVREHLNSS